MLNINIHCLASVAEEAEIEPLLVSNSLDIYVSVKKSLPPLIVYGFLCIKLKIL